MVQLRFRSKNAPHESHLFEIISQAGVQFLALRNDDRFAGGIGVQLLGQLPIIQNRGGWLPALDDEYRFVVNDIGFTDLL
jgi:hypothetical protein